jgi:hypothetical protein
MASNFYARAGVRSAYFTPRARSLRVRMTRHIAAALIFFALAQIWLVAAAIDAGAPRLISIAALLTVIGVAIPYARLVERRWQRLGEEALPSPALTHRYRRDVARLWLLALLVPVSWVGTALLISRTGAAI